MARTRGPSVYKELVSKSREAALNAVQTFNNPLTTFKTETFIVLITVAWTYLLHAYYRHQGLEYRYFEKKEGAIRRRFKHTDSKSFQYWSIRDCLKEKSCPLDEPTKTNLHFLIGLRNEIEHHQSAGVDEAFTGRYIACLLNYEREVTRLFGKQYSLAPNLSYALQLGDFTSLHVNAENTQLLPSNIARYIGDFDSKLSDEHHAHPHFSFRVIFTRKTANRITQADQAFEFIDPNSELADKINKQYWIQKEVERPKFLPGKIVQMMKEESFLKFNMYHHTDLWKKMDARKNGKGYGIWVEKTWYWYERWIDQVRKHCEENRHRYTSNPDTGA